MAQHFHGSDTTPCRKAKDASVGGKISVCLITYNHVDLIESTLRSIQNQNVAEYEIIVSDDCSTDGTWERILSIATTDARIRPIQTPRNMGMPGNANFAVKQSDRPYIALLHHDDLYREDLLEKWAAILERYPAVTYVFNPYGLFESDHIYQEHLPAPLIDGDWLLNKYLLPRWGSAVRGTAMIRRDAWVRAGGMREEFNLLADVDLWMRLARHASVGYVPEPIISVRQDRPQYYPDIYKDKIFSWRRQRYMYEIHASNRREYLDLDSIPGQFQWFIFRLRLSVETTKWLAYALFKMKSDMIISSRESETPYDLWPLRVARNILRRLIVNNHV